MFYFGSDGLEFVVVGFCEGGVCGYGKECECGGGCLYGYVFVFYDFIF